MVLSPLQCQIQKDLVEKDGFDCMKKHTSAEKFERLLKDLYMLGLSTMMKQNLGVKGVMLHFLVLHGMK